jgi:hypothetical protein
MPPPVEFTPSESAFIQSTGDRDLMLPAIELVDIYNDLLKLVTAYSERRGALTASFEAEEEHGNYVGSLFDQSAMRRLVQHGVEVKLDPAGNIKRDKWIDGISALVNALGRALPRDNSTLPYRDGRSILILE